VRLYLLCRKSTWMVGVSTAADVSGLSTQFHFPVSINFRRSHDIRQFPGTCDRSMCTSACRTHGVCLVMSVYSCCCLLSDAEITVWRDAGSATRMLVGGSMPFGAILACMFPLVNMGIKKKSSPVLLVHLYRIVAADGV